MLYLCIQKNNKTSCTHKLLFNLSDKIDLKKGDKYVALSNLRIYYTWGNIKLNKNSKSKFQLRHRMKCLNYLMDHIMYKIFKNIVNIFLKNMNKRLIIMIILQ